MIPAYSPDGKLLGVASEGDKICLFEGGAATPRIVDGEVRGSTVAFSPDGKRFAVGGVDGRLRVWETATGKLLTSLREGDTARARMATWTHDGRAVAVAYNEGGTIRLFSTEMPPPEPGSGQISPGTRPSVAVSPDGETIVTGGEDGRLRFHDRRTGTEVLSLKAHQGAVLSVAYAPDGTVATGGSDGQVRIWDPLGRPLKTMSTPTPFVMSVAFADGGRLVSAADGIQVWDLETGILQRALAVEGANDYPAVSGDEMALGHADGFVSRWSLATGREIERVSLTKDSVDRVAYTHGGRGLAAVTTNGNVLVRDGAGPARNLGSVNCGAEGCLLAAQGERLAVIQLHHRISAWNLATGRRIDFYGEAFQGITLSPDGKTIAGLSPHGILHVWEAETGRPLWRGPILRHTSGEVYTQEGWKSLLGKPAGGSEAWRRAVEADALLTAENGDVLCIYTLDGAVEIWSESRDQRLARVPVPGVGNVDSSDRGCVVLTSIPGAASLVDREGKLEELASKATAISARGNTIQVGLEDRVLTLDGATASTEVVDPGVIALARTSEGDLVLGYDHGAIEVRRAGAVLAMKDTPTTQVLRVVASPNLLAAAYTDGTIGLWSTKNGQLLQRWWLHGQARGMTLADSRLLVVTEVGQVGAWNVETFSLPYCQLLQEVWRAVPVVWESGRPVLKSPPAGHPCSGNH